MAKILYIIIRYYMVLMLVDTKCIIRMKKDSAMANIFFPVWNCVVLMLLNGTKLSVFLKFCESIKLLQHYN